MELDELVERIRKGDRGAEEELHGQLAPELLLYVRSQFARKLASRLGPDDVVQETLAAILRVLRKGERPIRHLGSFARTVARHILFREGQRRSAAFRSLGPPPTSSVGHGIEPATLADGPKTSILRRERDEIVAETLRELSPRDAEILRLRFSKSGRKLRFKEIGEKLDMSPEAAEKAYQRARDRFKARLRRRYPGSDDSAGWLE